VSARTRGQQGMEGEGEGREGEGEGREGEGRGGRCIRADAHVRADASVLPQVTSKRTLQCVQVTDAPAAIVRPSVCPSVCPKLSA
jgi:hypothetical protein